MIKMTRPSVVLAAALAATLALSACGKADESASQPPPPATPPAAQPEVMPAPPPVAAAAVAFSGVKLGSSVDATQKIVAGGDSFAPKDTIYASVDTSGTGAATLAAKWSYQDGQVVHQDSKSLNASGPQTTAFSISKPSGFPAGDYKVEISLNGAPVASKDFSVK